jgi:hypothetical protein
MSSNKRPRKAYRPRPIVNPLAFIQPASARERFAVLDRFAAALEEMARGSAPTVEAWRDLSDALNTVETMVVSTGHLDAAEVMPTVLACIKSMAEAGTRHRAGGSLRLDGAGLQALREVIGIYAQCMERLTGAEVYRAQVLTQQRMVAAMRGHRVAGVEVVTC